MKNQGKTIFYFILLMAILLPAAGIVGLDGSQKGIDSLKLDESDITITISAYNPIILIPEQGGSFDYHIEVVNGGAAPASFDVWTSFSLAQSPLITAIEPFQFQIPAGWSTRRDLTQNVTGALPSGNYTFTAYVGNYPNIIWDSDSFTFEKLPGSIGWYSQSVNTSTIYGIDFTDADTGWAVGNGHQILHTVNGGDSWYPQDYQQPYAYDFNALDFVDNQTGWVVGSTILKTTDGGENWTEQTPYYDIELNGVSFVDANHGWAVGGYVDYFGGTEVRVIEYTADGGNTWYGQLGQYNYYPLNAVHFTDVNSGWTVGPYGAILHTNNGGSDWVEQSSGTTLDLKDVHFANASDGWCVGENGVILRTANSGNDWSAQNSGTTSRLEGVYFLDANEGWAVGVDTDSYQATILHTTDGGNTWNAQNPGTADADIILHDVFFVDENQGWAAGSLFPATGVMLHSENGGGGSVEPVLSFDPPSFHFGDMYEGLTASTTFAIWNGGTGALSYSLSASCPDNWVTFTPDTGSSTGEHDIITVEIDTTFLDPGLNQCDITIFSNGGNDVFTVYVNILEPNPVLSFDPVSYDFGDVQQYRLVTMDLSIWNSGTGVLYYWLDDTSCDWIVSEPWSGSSSNGEVNIHTIQCFTSPLGLGPHQCDVLIRSSAGDEVFTVYVNVVP